MRGSSTAGQRMAVAKKLGRGLWYTLEIYVPVRSHGASPKQNEYRETLASELFLQVEQFISEIEEKNGLVQILRDC